LCIDRAGQNNEVFPSMLFPRWRFARADALDQSISNQYVPVLDNPVGQYDRSRENLIRHEFSLQDLPKTAANSDVFETRFLANPLHISEQRNPKQSIGKIK
jgi:hypothetical protein